MDVDYKPIIRSKEKESDHGISVKIKKFWETHDKKIKRFLVVFVSGLCLLLAFVIGRLTATSRCDTTANTEVPPTVRPTLQTTTFTTTTTTPTTTTTIPTTTTTTLALIDGIKICRKNDSNTCLGLMEDGRVAYSADPNDKTIHWRLKKKPGVPSSSQKMGRKGAYHFKGYLENLSNCKMLDVTQDGAHVKISEKNRNNLRQVWTMEEAEREHWYDDLFFRFKNENFSTEDSWTVLEVTGKNPATVKQHNATNDNQQFLLEETLDNWSPCEVSKRSGIQPFSG